MEQFDFGVTDSIALTPIKCTPSSDQTASLSMQERHYGCFSSRQTPARSMFMESSAPVHYHISMNSSKLGTTCQVRMNRVKYAAKRSTLAYRIYTTFWKNGFPVEEAARCMLTLHVILWRIN